MKESKIFISLVVQQLLFFSFCCVLLIGCKQKKIKDDFQDIAEFQEDQESTEDYLNKDIGVLLKTYEDPTRGLWQNPDLVVEKLGELDGKVVADIGVGTGYFTFKVANSAEKVIAIDVESKFLEYIEERKFELSGSSIVRKIETRLCQEDDPLLEPEEADVALIVDTYHFITNNRVAYMKNVYKGLNKNGVVLLVDYKVGQMPVGPPETMKVQLNTAVQELRNAGFTIQEIDTASLQFQYILKAIK